LSAFGVSVISGWITGLLAWIFKNPWYGIWIFLGTFLLAEAVQAIRAYRLSRSETEAVPEQQRDELSLRGIPEHMIAERHIRYHNSPIRLVDLLEIAGENGVLRDFTFEHCILEGPGIINLEGPFPKRESRALASGSGFTASLSILPTHCRVEGSPDTTLYQIARGAKIPVGVIHLSGYKFESVTFKGLGFVGTPEHLKWLQEHLIFSEGSADE
jgi:hypothetical protein